MDSPYSLQNFSSNDLNNGSFDDLIPTLIHSQLISKCIRLQIIVRFGFVITIVIGSISAKYLLGIHQLEVFKLLGLAVALIIYNFIVLFIVRSWKDSEENSASNWAVTSLLHSTIMLDFVFLTIVLWLVGGAKSPVQAFYIFHVIVASVLLSKRAAFAHATFGYFLLAGLVIAEWLGWIPPCYPEGAVSGAGSINGRYVITLLTIYGTLFMLSAFLLTHLNHLLRIGECNLRIANSELRRLSALRRDLPH